MSAKRSRRLLFPTSETQTENRGVSDDDRDLDKTQTNLFTVSDCERHPILTDGLLGANVMSDSVTEVKPGRKKSVQVELTLEILRNLKTARDVTNLEEEEATTSSNHSGYLTVNNKGVSVSLK